MLSDVSFYASDDECDDDNVNAKFDKNVNAKSNLSFPIHVTQPVIQEKLLLKAMLQLL